MSFPTVTTEVFHSYTPNRYRLFLLSRQRFFSHHTEWEVFLLLRQRFFHFLVLDPRGPTNKQ
jgi:hypothetical protein